MDSEPTLAVIVPATDDPPTLPRCIEAIRAGTRAPEELLVVAEPRRAGPASARNRGARSAASDVLVFVDADVVVHADALARIAAAFAADPSLSALFGAYDDSPEAPGAVAGFRNLLHHHVHHSAAGAVETFWAGLGAVRREAFLEAGGFDEARYPRPSIEDIELGARLAASGRRILLLPEVRGTHLKQWSIGEMLRTDFARRGLPWVELLAGSGASRSVLNLGWRHRVSAVLSLVGAGCLLRRRPGPAILATAGLVALNRPFYALLLERRGARQAALGVGLHAVHHLTGAAALAAGLLRAVLAGRSSGDARITPDSAPAP